MAGWTDRRSMPQCRIAVKPYRIRHVNRSARKTPAYAAGVWSISSEQSKIQSHLVVTSAIGPLAGPFNLLHMTFQQSYPLGLPDDGAPLLSLRKMLSGVATPAT